MKKVKNSDVKVIIPAFNEADNIADVIHELNQMGCRNILLIDGNSRDRTIEVAKDLGVNVILQNGRGKGAALRQAFNHDGIDGEVIVMMDADGSMTAKEIPLFLEAIESGADLVKGSRFMLGGYSEDMNFIRRVGNQLFVSLVNLFWSADYTDLCYGFVAFRKDVIEKLCQKLRSTNFEIETEIFIKAQKLGLNIIEVPSFEFRRRHGKSNLHTFKDGFRILKTIIGELGAHVL